MAKTHTTYFCQSCGSQSAKWIGKCPNCNEWNTYVEEVVGKSADEKAWRENGSKRTTATKARPLSEVSFAEQPRILLADPELNRVLGGGIVPGSVVLLGGEPGIGKSTLLLQMALSLQNAKVLYVSGEESEMQIRMRAERMQSQNLNCFVLAETDLSNIFSQAKSLQPGLVIVDSIQTLTSKQLDASAGSVSQIRECTGELLRYAKETQTPVVLIGHITKDGQLAGPKVLEHMVDTVLQFEGDRHHAYRILRAMKNRFGSASEIGIYEMKASGMHPVANPSEVLMNRGEDQLSGTAIAATVEGIRPLLIEVQALVSTAVYGTPQRSSTGFDLRRLNMLLAVLEKRCGFRLGMQDVFLNIAGGIRVDDPGIDLAVIAALLSSHEDIPLPANQCYAGEVGLTGEIRPVARLEQRIAEAEKLGLEKIMVSSYGRKSIDTSRFRIEVQFVSKVDQAFSLLFA
ncbi:MAG: DNA repair protein RadA [Flavobacteriales bacterium]|nr:DNA repair protein RadA [Flavobacteriales bacterium]MCB9449692.1 DNA repair protein RadA [Flavobacteriales bacterium]